LVRLHTEGPIDAMLGRIQNELFDLGAELATPDAGEDGLKIQDAQVLRLEAEIDFLNRELAPLRSFVLPGGSKAAGFLHLARTVARRAERQMVALSAQEVLAPAALKYINRLSDLLFVMARFANAEAKGDVLWVPGKTRIP